MSCRPNYDPCLDGKLNQIGSYAAAARSSATNAAASAESSEDFSQASATSATNAATSATQANNYLTQVENIFEDFDERYLGAKAAAPIVDNQGNPLQEGAMYWNSVANSLYVWDGSVWVALPTGFNEFTNFLATGTPTSRNLVTRFADVVNVKDFGAVGNGIADDEPAFSAAIAAATGTIANDDAWNVPFSIVVTIYVPAGLYFLGSLVDTGGKEVIYILDSGTDFAPNTLSGPPWISTLKLNGRVFRPGLGFSADHYGIKGRAGTLSLQGNPLIGMDESPFINGFNEPYMVADIPDSDSCTLVVADRNPIPLATISAPTYTATSMSWVGSLNADQLKKMRVGMMVNTRHSPKYSGFVTSWTPTSVNVTGWFQFGNQSAGQVPANGIGAMINNFTKIFTQNNVLWFDRGIDKAYRASGFELSIHNSRSSVGAIDPTNETNTDYLWGFDSAIAGGKYGGTVAFLARGPYRQAFHAAPQDVLKTTGVSYSRIATLVTITSTAHGFANNDVVKITNASDSGLNGYQTITVISSNTYSFNTSSGGTAIGTLDVQLADYSNIGFLYEGNGIGYKFINKNLDQGRAIEIINTTGPNNPAFVLYGNGAVESRHSINLTTSGSGSVIFSENTGVGNSICRLKTVTNEWSLTSWNAGHFSILEQSSGIEKLKVDAAPSTDPIWVYVNGTLKQVTEGAVDSGGTGFKVLRVAN